MLIIIIGLALLVAVVTYFAYKFKRRVHLLLGRLQEAVPYLKKAGLDVDALQPFMKPLDWVMVKQGGNNQRGVTGGLGLCPCQSEYTANTRQTKHRQMPNQQQIQNCVNNPPPTEPAGLKCPDDCVQVQTHIWHGWQVVRNQRKGQFRLNCTTFAQYHCKKPDDPAVHEKPQEGPPPPEVEI